MAKTDFKNLKNNSGFTLAEMIISFALLSIVAFTTIMLMSAGTNMFTNVDKQVNVQYKSQTAMAQFQEYILSVDGGVMKDGNAYVIADRNGATDIGSGRIIAFIYDEDEDKLFLLNESAQDVRMAGYDISGFDTQQFCSGVTDFEINTISESGTSMYVRKAISVSVSLEITEKDRSYVSTQSFALRNKPALVVMADTESGYSSRLETLIKEVWN